MIAEELRNKRLKLGLQQKDLGKTLGVSGCLVSHWETLRQKPSAKQVEKLAEIFLCKPEEIWQPWLDLFVNDRSPKQEVPLINFSDLPKKQRQFTSPNNSAEKVDSEEFNKHAEKVISDSLSKKLHSSHREVIQKRFMQLQTLAEVGKEAGKTRERIRQLEMSAIGRMKYDQSLFKLWSDL